MKIHGNVCVHGTICPFFLAVVVELKSGDNLLTKLSDTIKTTYKKYYEENPLLKNQLDNYQKSDTIIPEDFIILLIEP